MNELIERLANVDSAKPARIHPTVEIFGPLISYDPETGALTWKIHRNKARIGTAIRTKDSHGYLHVRYKYMHYLAHRIAWMLHYGEWPQGIVDHKDGNHLNNRISNLRLATPSQNLHNRRADRRSPLGIRGVSFNKRSKRFVARIAVDSKNKYIGSFDTKEEAAQAYADAAIAHIGGFTHPTVLQTALSHSSKGDEHVR